MDFHASDRVDEIGAFQVPWNSMEPLVPSNLGNSKLWVIPQSFMLFLVIQISWVCDHFPMPVLWLIHISKMGGSLRGKNIYICGRFY